MTEKARIRVGNQTAYFASPWIQPFEFAAASGFDAFEFFPDKKETGEGWEENDISDKTRAFIKSTAAGSDISLSVHAPWQLNPLRPGDIINFSRTLRFAKDIGARLIIIHLYAHEGIGAFAGAIVPLINSFVNEGVKLSIENTPETGPQDFNELFNSLPVPHRLSPDSHAHVGMCLDIGHANLCDMTRNDYLKFLDMLGPHVPVIHIHAHENYGDYDSHLPLFTGPAGIDTAGIRGLMTRLKMRNFSGSIILEQWPRPESLLKEARNRLLEIID